MSLFPLPALAAAASGAFGDDNGWTWVLEGGTLTITGEGEMLDFNNYSSFPP